MKLVRLLCVVALLAAPLSLAAAPAVEIGGFIDSRFGFDLDDKELAPFIDSMELWFDAKISDWLTASVTIGTYFEDGPRDFRPELGSAFLTATKENDGMKMSLGAGLFDVPFGIASYWASAPDNAFAYAPGVSEDFFAGGWYDFGIFGKIEADQFGLILYLVQGESFFSDNILLPYETDKGLAGGLRATFSPSKGISFGLSYALNAHYNDAFTKAKFGDEAEGHISLVAGDVELELGSLTLTYQYTAMMPKFEFGERNDLWFAQAVFSLEEMIELPISLGVRFDYFTESMSEDPANPSAAHAITFQIAYQIEEYLRLGLSFRTREGENNVLMLQAMAMF